MLPTLFAVDVLLLCVALPCVALLCFALFCVALLLLNADTRKHPQKYTGWSLADEEFTSRVDPKKARVVFYIIVAGLTELPGLDALLRTLYHVDHFFLVHLDSKVSERPRTSRREGNAILTVGAKENVTSES